MQYFFPVFPDGKPGIGLFVLRLALAIATVIAVPSDGMSPAYWLTPLLWILGALVSFGAMTRIACLVYALVQILMLSALDSPLTWVTVLTLSIASSLILIGPGAYAIDAYLFGRRVVVLPSKRNKDDGPD